MNLLPTIRVTQHWDKLHEWMWDSKRFLAQLKKDGGRYFGYHDKTGCKLLSKDRGLDRLGNFPHIRKFLESLPVGTIVDGEICAATGAFKDIQGVLTAGPDKAGDIQREKGIAPYTVFDVLFYAKKDLRTQSLKQRNLVLESIFATPHEGVVLIPSTTENKRQYYLDYVSNGGEGIILKDLELSYGLGWVKVKHEKDVSVIITAIMQDRTSLEISVYDSGQLGSVGHVSTNSHDLRTDIVTHPDKYLMKVLDITCLGLQDKSIRSAAWHRLRPDVDPKTVTKQKLLTDIKTLWG